MKVAILEPHNYHFDVLNSQCKIFNDKIEYIIINENALNHLENRENYKKIITLKENITCFEALKISFFLNKSDIDYVFMPTIQSHLLFYLFFFLFCNKRKIPTIHNINTYYVYPKNFKAKIRFFIRKLILLKSYGINVLGDELGNYLQKKGYKKLILNMPARLYEEKEKYFFQDKKEFIISIPGSFETKRRDYQIVYNVYKRLLKDKENIKINFLGNCLSKNKNDMKLFNKFKKIGNIFYKEEFILEEEFKVKVKESDILLSPTRLDFEYNGIIEKYGESKQTGFIYLPIEFSKIAIVPKELKIDKNLESSILKYKDEEDLYNIILKLYEDKRYKEKLQKEAITNSRKFELKAVRKATLNKIYNS